MPAEEIDAAGTEPARQIVSTRVVDAARDVVFQAFTDPARLQRWWGPKGFSNTFQEFDPRPGGRWRFVMHGPDGGHYKNESVFGEIVKPERIVIEHVSDPQFQLTITAPRAVPRARLAGGDHRLAGVLGLSWGWLRSGRWKNLQV